MRKLGAMTPESMWSQTGPHDIVNYILGLGRQRRARGLDVGASPSNTFESF